MGLLNYLIHRTPETQEQMRQRIIAGDVPKWIANRGRNRYIAQVVISMPPWVDRHALRAILAEQKAVTLATGVQHHVSHIVPLNHPLVCGLTVPWNLTIQPAAVNMRAGNRQPWPDMATPQLELWNET